MAKKQETNIAQKASLIISKEDFKSRLDECISRGEEVLKIDVPYMHYAGRHVLGYQDPKESAKTTFETQLSNWKTYCLEVLKQSFDIPNNNYHRDFSTLGTHDVFFATGNDVIQAEKDELYKKIEYLTNLRDNLLPLLPISPDIKKDVVTSSVVMKPTKNVFIVHGHDISKLNEVELLINTLGYNPIILCKEPNKGQTITEKIESNAEGACYAIVIYSACDMGRDKNDKEEHPRARQNVVFEHGYLNGKLGRDKVAALVEDGVEQPGDLSGIVYIPFDNADAWKLKIVKEMKAIGLDVDANKIC